MERRVMAKLFGMHEIELRPGVKGEDFEKFLIEEVKLLPIFEGWKTYLLKADRGERNGKYLLLLEIESVEARDRYVPSVNQLSEEAEQILKSQTAMFEKWGTLATVIGQDTIFTDYIVVGE